MIRAGRHGGRKGETFPANAGSGLSFFLPPFRITKAHDLAHSGVVETEVVTNLLHRVTATGVSSAYRAIPVDVLLCESSEWLRDSPHPGLWHLAQITAIWNLAPQRIDEVV